MMKSIYFTIGKLCLIATAIYTLHSCIGPQKQAVTKQQNDSKYLRQQEELRRREDSYRWQAEEERRRREEEERRRREEEEARRRFRQDAKIYVENALSKLSEQIVRNVNERYGRNPSFDFGFVDIDDVNFRYSTKAKILWDGKSGALLSEYGTCQLDGDLIIQVDKDRRNRPVAYFMPKEYNHKVESILKRNPDFAFPRYYEASLY